MNPRIAIVLLGSLPLSGCVTGALVDWAKERPAFPSRSEVLQPTNARGAVDGSGALYVDVGYDAGRHRVYRLDPGWDRPGTDLDPQLADEDLGQESPPGWKIEFLDGWVLLSPDASTASGGRTRRFSVSAIVESNTGVDWLGVLRGLAASLAMPVTIALDAATLPFQIPVALAAPMPRW